MQPAEAYRRCAEIARASGTSFYRGMRLLPRPRRDALFAIYAFARKVDDAADEPGSADEKLAALATLRAWEGDEAVFVALADACSRYPIPADAFGDLVDGAEMDVRGARFATFDELVVYCRRVAGSIGRLSVGVFEARERARAHAREDAAAGRVYLPQEDLDAFGVDVTGGERFGELVRFEAARAEEWYDRGLELLPLLDRSSASSVSAMAGAYRRLLRRIEREPEAVLTQRVTLPTWEKGWVAARSLVGAA